MSRTAEGSLAKRSSLAARGIPRCASAAIPSPGGLEKVEILGAVQKHRHRSDWQQDAYARPAASGVSMRIKAHAPSPQTVIHVAEASKRIRPQKPFCSPNYGHNVPP